MSHPDADVIDLLAGIRPGDPLDTVRSRRSQARENAQRSFQALLEPEHPGGFPLAERYAVAAFVAGLHGFDAAADFYRDLLGDEAPQWRESIDAAVKDGATRGPYGGYREPGLQGEGRDGLRWQPGGVVTGALGGHLAAALTHAHLLVFRPREARPDALRALVAAGWSGDAIVTLSQLVAFLSFQLRFAWGLRVLAATPASSSPAAPAIEGALR